MEHMPERTVTGLTRATLKFAAGDDVARQQVSSTWYVRFTRGPELYVLNREAGGNRAHISFHKDGRCHYKIDDPDGRGRVIAEWELPEPMEEGGMRRLATVVIPHRGLVVPEGFSGPEDGTVLIPPPAPDHCLEVDILLEPGSVPKTAWPGQTAEQRTALVGRFSLYNESPDEGLLNFTVVSSVRPEGATARMLSTMSISVAEGIAAPTAPRAVMFEQVEVDGQRLPVLTEMPVGHMTETDALSRSPIS